jgi:hypothetical protein
MSPRTRVLLASALGACAALWLFTAPSREADDGVAPRREAASDPEAGALTAPTLEGVAAPSSRLAAWTLKLTVEGVSREGAPPIEIQVSSVGKAGAGDVIASTRLEPGVFDADLDVSAFRSASSSRALLVRAHARGYFWASAHVELPEDPDAQARGGRLACTVTLEAGALLRGRVLLPDGTPAVACVEAGVAEGGRFSAFGDFVGPRQVETDEHGTFELLLHDDRPWHLHVTEKHTTSTVPATACLVAGPFVVRVGEATDVGILRLSQGLEQVVVVRGRVSSADGVWAARVDTGDEDHHVHASDDTLIGLLAENRAGRRGSAAGEFVVPGLRPGTWSVSGMAPNWGCALGHEAVWDSVVLTRVPGPPVELDLRRALLRVRVRGPGGPVDRALVTIQGEHALAFTTDAGGHGAVVLRPATRYRVRVDAEGHATFVGDALTAADGEEGTLEVDLSPGAPTSRSDVDWADHAVVSLTLSVKHGDEHLPARFAVHAEDGTRLTLRWVQRANVVTWLVTDRLLGLGEAHCVDVLPPGDLTFTAELDGFESARTVLRRGPFPRGARNVSLVLRAR